MNPTPIQTQIIPSVLRSEISPAQVGREFTNLMDSNVNIEIAGNARKNHATLFSSGLRPKHRIDLFDTRIYLTNVQQIPELRFFVAYVVQASSTPRTSKVKPSLYPRIFYKDLSLAWRSASHFSRNEEGIWVGKGDVRPEFEDGEEYVTSIESTTDLPLEMQNALDQLVLLTKRPRGNEQTLDLILKRSPTDRVEPYQDFTAPRIRAASNPSNLINNGKAVAEFLRPNDPASLKIVKGFEPDFKHGVLESSESKSKLYHGRLRRFRILSANKIIQYYFLSGPQHTWIVPPQATTTELSSYCVRTIDVVADDHLFIPGYEYHHMEETATGKRQLYSQIPSGFAGNVCPLDDAKADASPWLDKIPVIQEFRRTILGKS